MPFDEHIRPDVASVLNAAAVLDITEFDLFRLAYARWHGERADDTLLEQHFVAYMFDDVVPIWVRHFARLVQRLHRRGRLDRVALGIARRPLTQQMVRRGVRFGLILVTALVVLVILAEFAARVLRIAERCFFPPCY